LYFYGPPLDGCQSLSGLYRKGDGAEDEYVNIRRKRKKMRA